MTRAIHGFGLGLRRRTQQETLPVLWQWAIGCLIGLLLTSAFSVIYLKDLSRRLFIQYQTLQKTQEQNEIQFHQLLLEKGAWSTPARIQSVATDKLNMVMLPMQRVVMLSDEAV